MQKYSRPMPKDFFNMGSGYKRAGILAAYDPSRQEDGEDHTKGLGSWQDRSNWSIVSGIAKE
jgi:hypothetical protein